nr:hypothetical protein [Candidatus Sigynarchaeum springense]
MESDPLASPANDGTLQKRITGYKRGISASSVLMFIFAGSSGIPIVYMVMTGMDLAENIWLMIGMMVPSLIPFVIIFLIRLLLEPKLNRLLKQQEQLDATRIEMEKKSAEASVERARLAKVSKLFKISEVVRIDDLASLLQINRSQLLEKLIEWSSVVQFKIVKDEIHITSSESEKLVAELDRYYASWGEGEQNKIWKI